MERNNSALAIANAEDSVVPTGALDGVTLMRYAQIYRDRASGGLEQHLRLLNHGLLQRHRLTILQMHLAQGDRNEGIDVENVGMGRILWVPAATWDSNSRLTDLPRRMTHILGRLLERSRQEGKTWHSAILSSMQSLFRNRGGHLRYKKTVIIDLLCQLLGTQKVDLLALHWTSYETDPLISQALQLEIPYVFINHFDDEHFSRPTTRKWIDRAAAIGAVSDRSIPNYLRGRCFDLSDAVDTEFFAPGKAQPQRAAAGPVVLLPARIHEGKGHLDLLEAARILIARKVGFVLCLAGAVDSEPLDQELRRLAAAPDMEGRILFLGEKSAEDLRDCYGMSSVVVLPSRSEGLPRVLLEAQAMEKPVVAYNNGGMSAAVLPNESGFLIETGDVKALADKIGFLLQNEAERLRMGRCGREFVSRKFDVAALVHRHEAFYLSALSRARARG